MNKSKNGRKHILETHRGFIAESLSRDIPIEK